MTEKHNATCKICGKSYYACMSCADTMKLHPFKSFTDTAEHFKVFQVVKGFSTGVYTKDEAKEKFKNIDLSDVESFRPHIKKIVKDILKEDEVVVEKVATKKITNEDVVIEEVVAKPITSRKRNYKVEAKVE